ncbi:MAG: hypothetical protein K0Q71_4882 [Thermomicrobiales bacterium]|nr:hypothetical protein [Thermomicrobiales bacterium]
MSHECRRFPRNIAGGRRAGPARNVPASTGALALASSRGARAAPLPSRLRYPLAGWRSVDAAALLLQGVRGREQVKGKKGVTASLEECAC